MTARHEVTLAVEGAAIGEIPGAASVDSFRLWARKVSVKTG